MDIAGLLTIVMFVLLIGGILYGIPAWLAIGGAPLVIAFTGGAIGVFDIVLLSAFPQRVLGMMGNQLLVAIPLFILMGVMLERSGLAEAMLRAVTRLARGSSLRLSLGVLAISALIAASTGVAGATIVMLGLIAWPALVRAGVPETTASGMTIASGTLGQIIPPSIVLIVLADQISNAWQSSRRAAGDFAVDPITVSEVFAAAMFPGLLLVLCYAFWLVVRLWRVKPLPEQQVTEAGDQTESRGLIWLLQPLFLIFAVLGSIVFGVATATEAAAIGASGAILMGGMRLAQPGSVGFMTCGLGIAALVALFLLGAMLPGLPVPAMVLIGILALGLVAAFSGLHQSGLLVGVLREVILISGVIFAIIMSASLLALVFRGLGGEEMFASLAAALPGEAATALLLVLVVVFVLGFALEFIEIVFIVVPIAGPVLFAMGVDPLWFAVLLAINLQTSFLTPPMGVALFYFRSVAPPSLPMARVYRGVIPFIVLQLLALVIVFLFPDLALWLPGWLFTQ